MSTIIDREKIVKSILLVYTKCDIRSFPVDCFSLLKKYHFTIYTYGELKENNPRIYELCKAYSDDAFSWKHKRIIAYNERQHPTRIRFSLMHELGHHILGHVGENQKNEDEADFFASNILAPRPIMYRLHCKNADDIHATFNISYAAANRAIRDYHQWIAGDIDQKMNAWFFPSEDLKAEEVNDIKEEPKKTEAKNAWVPSKEFEERRAKVLARRERRKRRLERKLKQYQEDMEFINGYDPDIAFARAEHQWLYGTDL